MVILCWHKRSKERTPPYMRRLEFWTFVENPRLVHSVSIADDPYDVRIEGDPRLTTKRTPWCWGLGYPWILRATESGPEVLNIWNATQLESEGENPVQLRTLGPSPVVVVSHSRLGSTFVVHTDLGQSIDAGTLPRPSSAMGSDPLDVWMSYSDTLMRLRYPDPRPAELFKLVGKGVVMRTQVQSVTPRGVASMRIAVDDGLHRNFGIAVDLSDQKAVGGAEFPYGSGIAIDWSNERAVGMTPDGEFVTKPLSRFPLELEVRQQTG